MDHLADLSRDLVKRSNRDATSYRAALEWSAEVVKLRPEYRDYVTILGIAQYRTGNYQAAWATLTRSDAMRAKDNPGGIPTDVAFIAMSLHRLGRLEEARQQLIRLRTLLELPKYADEEDSRAFLHEAEELIEMGKDTTGEAATGG